jgi:hypothetical protein
MSTALGIGLAVISAVSFWPGSAHATMYSVSVTLNEAQAISTCDPNPAPAGGGGTGVINYDDSTNMLSWNISFSNLSGAAIAAHFHGPAGVTETAGVQVPIGDLSSPSVGSFVITESQEAQLLSGLWYVNYHTAACGGGEIRGQVAGNGVGGVTELSDPAIAPLTTTPKSDSSNGMIIGLAAAAIAAVTLVGAGGALLAGRRLIK